MDHGYQLSLERQQWFQQRVVVDAVVAEIAVVVVVPAVAVVVEANDAEQEDENFGEGADYDDVAPCGKEQMTWVVVDGEEACVGGVVGVAVVAQGAGVSDGAQVEGDAAVGDGFDPKDPVEEEREAEALERGMGLSESAVVDVVDA